jgi:hypothetical protein
LLSDDSLLGLHSSLLPRSSLSRLRSRTLLFSLERLIMLSLLRPRSRLLLSEEFRLRSLPRLPSAC